MPKWTKEQQSVIDTRDADILVTAAAGSGKTTVLVERIIRLLLEENSKTDIDRLLVVTFTEAAASEMRDKIMRALEDAYAKKPDDGHLSRQLMLIHHAPISTIHGFCLSVIRDHFHKIDLDPSFRVLDEAERDLLMQDILDEILEECYSGESEAYLKPEAFYDFAEAFETKRKDNVIEKGIRQLFDEAMGLSDPEDFLLLQKEKKAEEWIEVAKKQVREKLEEVFTLLQDAVSSCEEHNGPGEYLLFFKERAEAVRSFLQADSFSGIADAVSSFSWGRFPNVKNRKTYDPDMLKSFGNRATLAKNNLETLQKKYFYAPGEEILADLKQSQASICALSDLTLEFHHRFSAAKRERGVIDFSDMEHLSLAILSEKVNGKRIPSAIAKMLREEFDAVMIDEYQDSSFIQETILSMVSGGEKHPHNRFMVGDVKQSIYGFRKSRPQLFLEKMLTYDKAEDAVQKRIDLHHNFRSREEVLNGINAIFYHLMNEQTGGIPYDEDAALVYGGSYEGEAFGKIDTYLLEQRKAEEDTYRSKEEQESDFIVRKVSDLVGQMQVRDESGKMRPAAYGDVAILVRSGVSWFQPLAKAFQNAGIPAEVASRTGYFDAEEIQVVLNYLRLLDNPFQDIPLAGTLQSEMGKFTPADLATIRTAYPEGTFYQAVFSYVEERNDAISDRLRRFITRLEDHRRRLGYTPLHSLINEILNETGYSLYLSAMPNGKTQLANLEFLIRQAMHYEKTSYTGVFSFLRYLDRIRERDVDYGEISSSDEKSNTVRIMTMHKSKGLEFPIVVLAGLGGQFHSETKNLIDVDVSLGVGMDAIYSDKRLRSIPLSRSLIRDKKALEARAEDLRLLYVAMTRAKEKLILTGSFRKSEDEWEKAEQASFETEQEVARHVMSAGNFLQLVLPFAMRSDEFYQVAIVGDGDASEEMQTDEIVSHENAFARAMRKLQEIPKGNGESELQKNLQQSMNWIYPFEQDAKEPFKRSVSEIKKQAMLHMQQTEEYEEGESLFEEAQPVPLIPKFMQDPAEGSLQGSGGALRGTAFHRFLEKYDYREGRTAGDEISYLTETGYLTEDMADMLQASALDRFLASPLGLRMKKADKGGLLHREQLFVFGEPLQESEEEFFLVQGIIDAYFEEEGELVLVDYKTDRVKNDAELLERYRIQLVYYKEALERLTGKKVKEAYIYSFRLGREVKVE